LRFYGELQVLVCRKHGQQRCSAKSGSCTQLSNKEHTNGPGKKDTAALIALAWLFVGIPWGWGVIQLWKNAQKLLVAPPPAATAPATPVSAPAATTPATTPNNK
jgi:hypothetical protein